MNTMSHNENINETNPPGDAFHKLPDKSSLVTKDYKNQDGTQQPNTSANDSSTILISEDLPNLSAQQKCSTKLSEVIVDKMEDDASFHSTIPCKPSTLPNIETLKALESLEARDPPPPYSATENSRSRRNQDYGPHQSENTRTRQNPHNYDSRRYEDYVEDDDSIISGAFDNIAVRHNFIRKVYWILSSQLLFTFLFVLLCTFQRKTKFWVAKHWEILIVVAVTAIFLVIMLTCYKSIRRKVPLNYFLLGLLTMCYSYLAGYAAAHTRPWLVVTAVGITLGCTLLVSIFACQTRWDITEWGMILCLMLLFAIIIGIIGALVYLFTGSKIIYIIYTALICIIMLFYIMYDTQLIVGGRTVALSSKEYIAGALSLYIDIMTFFIYLITFLRCVTGN